MVIKNVTLENGHRPVICIPVMGSNGQEVIAEAQRVIGEGARMIEWRMDYLEDYTDLTAIRQTLTSLAQLCDQVVLLVTLRTVQQGGKASMGETQLRQFYLAIAQMRLADLIDVEFFTIDKPESLLRAMKNEGARVITSHHDFVQTPEESVMMMLLSQMADGGADIAKIAVMPQSLQDVLDLLRVTCCFAEEYPEVPVASMSMGSMGIISRLCGEVFGSCMTFGTMGVGSAPGQMPEEQLRQILDIIHSNFER